MGQFFSDNWTGLVDVVQTVITFVGVLVAAGFFVRHRREVKDLLYVEQERDEFRKKNAQIEVRLGHVDPGQFIDRANELRDKGDFAGLEEEAVGFAERQTEAFGLAAEILTEQRILDSEKYGEGAIEEAQRFAEIGLAARPDSIRLAELKTLVISRAKGIKNGEPIEALNFEGMSDVELNQLAHVLVKDGKYVLAEIAAKRSVPLAFLRTGANSTNYAGAIGDHASCLEKLGDFAAAEPLYRQAIQIGEAALGKEHPSYARDLNNLAGLLETTGRYDKAEPLYRQAMEIGEATLGKEHPNYAIRLNNLALLLHETRRSDEAEPLMEQALAIVMSSLGEADPNTVAVTESLAMIREVLKD